jgi:hypothetical protein
MKNKSTSRPAFFNLRALIGLFVCVAGVLIAFGAQPQGTASDENTITRQDLVKMYRATAPADFVPPACVPGSEMFTDVPASNPFCQWIEELSRRGITSGCTPTTFCPSASVTRQQMAPFLIKAITGVGVVITDPGNTAVGDQALSSNTGEDNTATGFQALFSNTTAADNTANGVQTLFSNTTGASNTATGFQALFSNTDGRWNTASGANALFGNTGGDTNTANGFFALNANTVGSENTAIGAQALLSNNAGFSNTAVGISALLQNTTGTSNTAIGKTTLFNSATGDNNIALGASAGSGITTASNVIAIGSFLAAEDVSNTCYIGNIFGTTSAGATAVYVNSLGKLGTIISSRRFKEEIKPMDKASEAILALTPVTFRYKQEIDPAGSPQFGLVAEDVEKVNPALVVRDAEGKVNTVRYEVVNVMLLNEFLKEHREVQEQEATITWLKRDFQSKLAEQQEQIEALTAGLQKVSAQVEMSRHAPQTVVENH